MTFVGYEWLLTFKVEFEVKLIHLKITLKYDKPKRKKVISFRTNFGVFCLPIVNNTSEIYLVKNVPVFFNEYYVYCNTLYFLNII